MAKNKDLALQILGEEFFYQLNDQDSELVELMDKYVFLFVLEKLDSVKRGEFLELLEKDPDVAMDYAERNIHSFQENLEEYLKTKIKKFLTKKTDK